MTFRTLILAGAVAALASTGAQAQGWRNNQFGNGFNSPQVYAPNGAYLGNLNGNQFDPNSVSNQFGPHGSQFAPNSLNNPYTYGSPFGYGGGYRR